VLWTRPVPLAEPSPTPRWAAVALRLARSRPWLSSCRDTRARVRRSLCLLERFPSVGRELEGRWRPFRFILGPWRWLLILYDEEQDVVLVATMQDARSSSAATAGLREHRVCHQPLPMAAEPFPHASGAPSTRLPQPFTLGGVPVGS
jgi:hypothetical protein